MSDDFVPQESAFSRLLRELRHDFVRVIVALFAAYMLWFLIGRKIETYDEFEVAVEVVAPEQKEPNQGLIIRVPPEFVVESVVPRKVTIKVLGTKEDLDRLRSQILATWLIAPEFMDDAPRARRVVDVKDKFQFAGFQSLTSLRVEEGSMISVTIAKRGTTKVTLTPETVELTGADLPEDAVFAFRPSAVVVSGAIDAIDRIKGGRARLTFPLGKQEVQLALREPCLIGSASIALADDGGSPTKVTFSEPKFVELRLERKLPPRVVRLESVPVGWLNVKSAWREGVDPEDPVAISQPTMWVEISVPNDFSTVGAIEDELRKRLNLFVDMREMPFSVEAQQLPVHVEGLPPGATIKLATDRIDVEWRRKEIPKTENGNE